MGESVGVTEECCDRNSDGTLKDTAGSLLETRRRPGWEVLSLCELLLRGMQRWQNRIVNRPGEFLAGHVWGVPPRLSKSSASRANAWLRDDFPLHIWLLCINRTLSRTIRDREHNLTCWNDRSCCIVRSCEVQRNQGSEGNVELVWSRHAQVCPADAGYSDLIR